jgi:hypothetical protein
MTISIVSDRVYRIDVYIHQQRFLGFNRIMNLETAFTLATTLSIRIPADADMA